MKETKKCPFCGEEILAVAKKCKFCGEWIEPKNVYVEKAKKACPICGEMIDEDAKICPYCHENVEIQPNMVSADSNMNGNSNHQGECYDGFLYCKKCGHRLSVDASVCSNCGDTDPFYFENIKRLEKKSHLGCWGFICTCVVVELIFQFFGVHDGIDGWLLSSSKWPQLLVLVILLFVEYCICKVLLKSDINKMSKEVELAFPNNANSDMMKVWWQRVKLIVGEITFDIFW